VLGVFGWWGCDLLQAKAIVSHFAIPAEY